MAGSNITNPVEHGFAITPNDSTDLTEVIRAIYVGVSGDLVVTLPGGDTLTFVSLAGGMIHPIMAKRVHATGTTADELLGFYN